MKRKFILLQFIILFSSIVMYAQIDTAHYSVVYKGKITGQQKAWRTTGNDYHYTYQFNDRGRGDSIVTEIKTNKAGLISFMDISGVNYFKAPCKETFSIVGDSVIWVANGNRKSKVFNNQLYVPSGTLTPGVYELNVKWALKQKDNRTELLPEGFMKVGGIQQKSISYKNRSTELKLVPVYLEPNPLPTYVWFTENMQFFALLDNWKAVIKKEYEGWIDTLLSLQEIADQDYFINEINENSRSLKRLTIFKNVSLFNSADASVKKEMTVEIAQGKIVSIHPASVVTSTSNMDTVIDCKGKFLMPGLWDMHAHYFKESGLNYMAGGVTHIRDMGNEKIILTYKKQIAENKMLGPDISYLSLLLDKEDYLQSPTGKIITTLEEGKKAIDEYKKLGFQQLKIYSSIKPEWVQPLAEHAHQQKMRVSGHIPTGLNAQQCIDKGYDEITHLHFIFSNFIGDSLKEVKGAARFRALGENIRKLDIQSPKVQNFIDLMKQKNIVVDPTLTILQLIFDEFEGDTIHYLRPVTQWAPETKLPTFVNPSPVGSEADKPAFKASFNNMLKMVKLLYDKGIFLVAGTDGGDANALHHELELYVEAGIPANQVLKIATYNAAKDCNLQNTYGQIVVGQPADFILIDGNPVQNISDIRRVEIVVKNNRMYKPKQLLSTQGWKYYY
jgi:imidazolonepropionase-like amidohydrolase